MSDKDYYEVLGVPKDASQSELKTAFRQLARKFHPDVSKEENAEELFKELNEAYEVLGDPEKRKKYDALGSDWKNPQQATHPPDSSGYEYQFDGTGFSDFFEQTFGAGTRPGSGSFHSFTGDPQGRDLPIPGQDAHADILVSLEEVMHGTERLLQLQQINRSTGISGSKSSRIRIPKGIAEGQLIRCAGLGNPGFNGGASGDLFLHVRLERHPDFRISGSDLYYELPLTPWEAVLGAEVPVRTLMGEVRIKIPPLTDNGTELRIKDRGLPKGAEGQFGHLYAVARIEIPKTLSKEDKKQWEELALNASFRPRA